MKYFNSKKVALFLAFILFFNIWSFAIFGSQRAQAGYWDDYKGSIFTVLKGLFMLWVINLMSKNVTGNSSDDIITSTIKKGLNIGMEDNKDDTAMENSNDKTSVKENSLTESNIAIINNDNITDNEFELLKLVNQARQEEGLKLLNIDMDITRIAREKAFDMVNNNYFSHNSPNYGTPFEMLKNFGISYTLAGENLAKASNVLEAFNLLMDSPDHKDNILKSRYDRVGIGVVDIEDSNKLMIVQIFIDSQDPAR